MASQKMPQRAEYHHNIFYAVFPGASFVQHWIKSRGPETPPQYETPQNAVAETLMRASVIFSCEPVGSEQAWIVSLTSELMVLLEKSAAHWRFSLSPLIPSKRLRGHINVTNSL